MPCTLLLVHFLFFITFSVYVQHVVSSIHRRFEYKYSFKGPHLTYQQGGIPFWSHYGDVIPSTDQVRVAPSLRSQRGSLWTSYNASFENWEVEMAFSISGMLRIGADGLAIWFTKERGPNGPVYGAADNWDGVGIFFDTYDNDDNGNNPIVLVVGNNGRLTYNHLNDGATQSLGSCIRDFRNRHYPVRARITYYKKTLSVAVNPGLADTEYAYESCAVVNDMILPKVGYFGVSAATGSLADDHDVLSFLTFSLREPGAESDKKQISDSERDAFQKEYEQFQKELEKRKEDYQKDHPTVSTPKEDEFYETDRQRELEMVSKGQDQIQQELNHLTERLKMMWGEQKRHSDILNRSNKEESQTTVKEGPTMAKSNLDNVLKIQKHLVQTLEEMRSSVSEIASKAKLIHQSSSGSSNAESKVTEIKEHVSIVKREMNNLLKNTVSGPNTRCPGIPSSPSCISTGHFLVFVILQTVFAMYYLIYRSKKESESKKFF
ncbi:protein ERGIC-53-like [Protopterus annectens]|uniref:protein ERGIC-53-like n=1 Tax=Protopterus annectens TaxID=7888 RepID=UPI001CF9D589|nr:protein ERGIC-53-like [Protopterus annectens]